MSAVGIPVGYAISTHEKNNVNGVIVMFSVRAGMVFLAALINTFMLYQLNMNDKKEINHLLQTSAHTENPGQIRQESCLSGWCGMFQGRRYEDVNEVPLLDISQIRNINELSV